MSTERAVAANLLDIQAVFLRPEEPFTWASGIKSPIYCDNRLVLSFPEKRSVCFPLFVKNLSFRHRQKQSEKMAKKKQPDKTVFRSRRERLPRRHLFSG